MKKATIAAILIIVILAGAAFGVIAYASDWFKLPVDRWGDRLGIDSNETPGDDDDDNNPPITGDGEVMDPDGVNVMPSAMAFSANVLTDGEDGTSVTIQAIITPENATNQSIKWNIKWNNVLSEWASGKIVTDYVTVTPDSSDSRKATITCLNAFGEQIIVTAVSESNPSINASCRVDYRKRYEVPVITVESENVSYSLFDKPITLIQPTSLDLEDICVPSDNEVPGNAGAYLEMLTGMSVGTVEDTAEIGAVTIRLSEGFKAVYDVIASNSPAYDERAGVITFEDMDRIGHMLMFVHEITYGAPYDMTLFAPYALLSLIGCNNGSSADMYGDIVGAIEGYKAEVYSSQELTQETFDKISASTSLDVLLENSLLDIVITVQYSNGDTDECGIVFDFTKAIVETTDVTLSEDSIIF